MERLIGKFPWPSERTSGHECRVYLRQTKGPLKVHIEDWVDGERRDSGVTFLPELLDELISVLRQARDDHHAIK